MPGTPGGVGGGELIDWREEWEEATTPAQMRNHAAHFILGIAGAFVLQAVGLPWWAALPWFSTFVMGKETFEFWWKLYKGRKGKLVDSMLDVAGWFLGAGIFYALRAAL